MIYWKLVLVMTEDDLEVERGGERQQAVINLMKSVVWPPLAVLEIERKDDNCPLMDELRIEKEMTNLWVKQRLGEDGAETDDDDDGDMDG